MLVEKYFQYLVDEFHYSVIDKSLGGNPSYGIVEFRTPQTVIQVTRQEDRPTDVVHVVIKPSGSPDDVGMSLKSILDALGIKDKLPDDNISPKYIEFALRIYSEKMREYCLEFIEGDFSKWNIILQHYLKSMKNWYKSVLGEGLPNESRYQIIQNYIREKDRDN